MDNDQKIEEPEPTDGVEDAEVLPADESPKSGEWVDSEEMIMKPTDEELAQGKFLGETIDTDDDDDNGL